jgi:hypothetical protein
MIFFVVDFCDYKISSKTIAYFEIFSVNEKNNFSSKWNEIYIDLTVMF